MADEAEDTIGARVRGLRETRGWSQATLAAKMSEAGRRFHQTTVNKIESGERRVSTAEAQDLAEVFDVSLDVLITGAPPADYYPPQGGRSYRTRSVVAALESLERVLRMLSRDLVRVRSAADRDENLTDEQRRHIAEVMECIRPDVDADRVWGLVEELGGMEANSIVITRQSDDN